MPSLATLQLQPVSSALEAVSETDVFGSCPARLIGYNDTKHCFGQRSKQSCAKKWKPDFRLRPRSGVRCSRLISMYTNYLSQQRRTIAKQANEVSQKVCSRADYFGSRRSGLRAGPNAPRPRG